MNWNKIYENNLRQQIKTYITARELVISGKYTEAFTLLESAPINESTRKQLRNVLETNDSYIINRIFGEVDARISQALCWDCWKS